MPRRRKFRKRRRGKLNETIVLGLVAFLLIGAVVDGLASTRGVITSGSLVSTVVLVVVIGVGLYYVPKWYRGFMQAWKRQQRFRAYYHADLRQLCEMDPFEFEKYVGRVFETKGYRGAVTSAQKDNGIDIRMHKGGKKYAVQVKRYAAHNSVGEPALRDFYGSFVDQGFEKGFFVTTSGFTPQALAWAKSRPIELIDGKAFLHMMSGLDDIPWYKLLFNGSLRAPLVTMSDVQTPIQPRKASAPIKKQNPEPEYKNFWPDL